jgi:hypothetical protein
MTDYIGWFAAAVLLATIGRQIYTQWRDGTTQGLSRWLSVGQLTARPLLSPIAGSCATGSLW